MRLSTADLVWNRAALDGGGANPLAGDAALAAVLRAHGMIMNGGVLHVFEALSDSEFAAAQEGYRFFGFSDAATLIEYANRIPEEQRGESESALDAEYARIIPTDGTLVDAFKAHFLSHPNQFAPLLEST